MGYPGYPHQMEPPRSPFFQLTSPQKAAGAVDSCLKSAESQYVAHRLETIRGLVDSPLIFVSMGFLFARNRISWEGFGGFLKWGYPQSSSILIGFSLINHPYLGTPILGNPHLEKETKRLDFMGSRTNPSGPTAGIFPGDLQQFSGAVFHQQNFGTNKNLVGGLVAIFYFPIHIGV